MDHAVFYLPGNNAALSYAGAALSRRGHTVVPTPGSDVTHLLLPVPSFEADGRIKGGGSIGGELSLLPENVTVIGGNLNHPALRGYYTMDLLQDPYYLAENAAITAHCTLKLILSALPVTLQGQQVLIMGWGRIGKCLARLLPGLGADVTVAARKPSDLAMAQVYGCRSTDYPGLTTSLPQYRVIINTVPAPVLTEAQTARCGSRCLKIDLASKQGIPGNDVIWARGLPGRDTPETSGELIANTVIRLIQGKEQPV